MIIDEELRAKLIPHLPDDYQKQGHDATGYSRSMIYKVLHEGHDNDDIYNWLTQTALKRKKQKERIAKKQAQIAEQL